LRALKPFSRKDDPTRLEILPRSGRAHPLPKVDAEFQREIDGIVAGLASRGVKADRWDIVALNAIEELPYYYVPGSTSRKGARRRPTARETAAPSSRPEATPGTGASSWGHNNWTSYVVGERWNIVFDIKPERGERILMTGSPA